MDLFEQLSRCKPCSHADPKVDTVKVDPALLASANSAEPLCGLADGKGLACDKRSRSPCAEPLKELCGLASGKENMEPLCGLGSSSNNSMGTNEKGRLQEEESFRKALAREEIRRQADLEAAQQRMVAEVEARRRRQEEEAGRAAEAWAKQLAEQEAEELKQQERVAQEAAEEARRAEVARSARLAEAAREQEELREAQAKVNKWCASNGFGDQHTQKKKLLGGWKYPLHTAVKQKDLAVVKALVKCGADKSRKDSKGQTAYELASKLNKETVKSRPSGVFKEVREETMAEFLVVLA